MGILHNFSFAVVRFQIGNFGVGKSQRMLGMALLVNPCLDFKVITIQQAQFPTFKESRQEEQTSRDTQQGHEGENNGNGRHVLHQKDQSEKEDLKDGVQVHLGLFHVPVEDRVGVSAGLLQPKQDAVPELHGGQGRETHKQEHTVQDRHGQQLKKFQNKQGQSNHQVRKEQGQTSLLHVNNVTILVLVSQTVKMDNARKRGGDQPGKTKDTIDKVEQTIQAEIVVVSFTVLQFVVGVVDQMPCDTVVEEAKQEGKDGRTSSNNGYPSLAVQVRKVDKPVTSSGSFGLIRTVIREKCATGVVAALEGRFELVRNVQLFSFNIAEEDFLDHSGNQHRHGDGKVMDRVTNTIVAKEGRVLEASEEEDEGGSSETKQGTEKSNFHVVVVWVVFKVFMRRVIGVKVSKDTDIRERITDGVKHKDCHNQKGKDFIRETSGETNDASQVEEGGSDTVEQQPAGNPCVESQERDTMR